MTQRTIKLSIIATDVHCVTPDGKACPFLTAYAEGDAGGPTPGLSMIQCGGPFNQLGKRFVYLEADAIGPRRHCDCLKAENQPVVPYTTLVRVPREKLCRIYDPRRYKGKVMRGIRMDPNWNLRNGL